MSVNHFILHSCQLRVKQEVSQLFWWKSLEFLHVTFTVLDDLQAGCNRIDLQAIGAAKCVNVTFQI